MADMVKRFCNTFLTEGIFLLVIGALLMLLPMVTTFAMSMLISVALVVAGVYKFINTSGQTIEQASSVLPSPSSMPCGEVSLDKTEFSKGKWSVVLQYQSNNFSLEKDV